MRCLSIALFLISLLSSPLTSSQSFGETRSGELDLTCLEPIGRDAAGSAYSIIDEVFIEKLARNRHENLIDEIFFNKIKDIVPVLCGEGSYEAIGYPSGRVVVDFKLIGFLFLQSRSLTIGGYLAREEGQDKSFAPYESLMGAFFSQDDALNGRAFEIASKRAIEEGLSRPQLIDIMESSEFQRQEQTLFLVMLYFLAAHEACHFGLDHHGDSVKPPTEKVRFRREFEADECALRLINADESHYKRSPIGFFGALAVIGTQAMLSKVLGDNGAERSHPASIYRFERAKEIIFKYLTASDDPHFSNYMATSSAFADFFSELIKK